MRGPPFNKALPPISISVARNLDLRSSAASQPSRDRGGRLPHAGAARQGAVPAVGHLPLIAEHRGLLITGPSGVCKSWLPWALAQKACRDGYTIRCARVPRLFADLDLAHGDSPARKRGSAGRGWDDLRADRCVGTRGVVGGSAQGTGLEDVLAASRGCSGCWSTSMTGAPTASRPASAAISWRLSRIAMAAPQR